MLSNEDLEKNKYYKSIYLGKNETPVECSLSTSSDDEISKILSISSSSEIENYEVLSSQVNYNGKIVLNVIYVNQNGELNNAKAVCSFSQKYENDDIEIDQKMDIDSNIVDVKIDRIFNDNVKLFVIIQNRFSASKNQTLTMLEKSNDYFSKTKQIQVPFKKAEGEENFVEKTLIETKHKIKKILNVECKSILSDMESGNNFVVVSGEVITNVLYVTEEEEPQIISVKQSIKIREEIECVGAHKESKTKAKIYVKNENITALLEESEEDSNIKVETPIKISYEVFENNEIEAVCDLYSVSHNLEIKKQNFVISEYVETKFFESKIEGNVTIDSQQPRIDKLLAVDAQYLTESNSFVQDGYLIVEGVAYATLIYLSDEEPLLNSVQIEIPYSLKEKVDTENINVRSLSFLSDTDITVRRGREIMFDGKVKTIALFTSEVEEEIMTEVSKISEVEKSEEAIEIFFAEPNQTFWDIAKEGKVQEEILKMQNSDIIEPFSRKEKIVYYRKKERV